MLSISNKTGINFITEELIVNDFFEKTPQFKRFHLNFDPDKIDWAQNGHVKHLTNILVKSSVLADIDARALRAGQYRGSAYFLDANGSRFYEAYYDTPYPYLGCFRSFHNAVVQESDRSMVKCKLALHKVMLPCLLFFPANDNISDKEAANEYERVADAVLSKVIRIENMYVHPLVQNKGIFTALVAALLEKYDFVLITAILNRKWAYSLRTKALEVYEERGRGISVILDKSFLTKENKIQHFF